MVMVYILLGTVIPMLFVTYLYFTKELHMPIFYTHLVFFFVNPFYTFFVSNFSMFRQGQAPHYKYIKLTLSTDLTPWVGCRTMLFQFAVCMGASILIDWISNNKFRFPDYNKTKIEQKKLEVRDDVKLSELHVKSTMIEKPEDEESQVG